MRAFPSATFGSFLSWLLLYGHPDPVNPERRYRQFVCDSTHLTHSVDSGRPPCDVSHVMKGRILTVITLIIAGLVVAALTAWGALAVYYLAPGSSGMRSTMAWTFAAIGLLTLTALIVGRARVPMSLVFVVA